MNRIITISREYGSGGRTIGRKAAERLGIPCYDAELISKIADKSGFTESYVSDNHDGNYDHGWFRGMFGGRDYYGETNQDYLWKVQRQVILELAEKESCIIVGRCADYILSDKADLLKVFIHAPLEFRAKHAAEAYGVKVADPVKAVRDMDKRRRSYYQFYTDVEWGKASNYDLCLNSQCFGMTCCADIIARLY